MTLPDEIRVFFALDLPLTAKEKLGGLINTLKKQAKTHAIRWTKPENLHITLQFLPEVKSNDLPCLTKNVYQEINRINNFTFLLSSLQLFPNSFRPRVIVFEVSQQQELVSLSGLIGRGITKSGYAIENRLFRGHLTLGRIKHAQGVNLDFLAQTPLPDLGTIRVSEVVLFRSEPQDNRSIYLPLERIALNPL